MYKHVLGYHGYQDIHHLWEILVFRRQLLGLRIVTSDPKDGHKVVSKGGGDGAAVYAKA